MNLAHLKTFVAVAELRHFARAASACNLSQPAVSHQIAQLEATVGAKAAESRRAPLQFHIGPVDAIADRVIRNDLDMAVIAGRPPSSELRAKLLCRDDWVAVRAPTTVVSGKEPLRRADIERPCWILREVGSATRREIDAWTHRHRLMQSSTMTFDGPDAVKRAVMAGLGIAIVSKSTVEEELRSRRLVSMKLALPLPAREFYLVDHPQKHHGAACGAMMRLLAETFPDAHLPLRVVAMR